MFGLRRPWSRARGSGLFRRRRVRRRRVERSLSDRRRIVPRCAASSTNKAAAEPGAYGHAVGERRRRFPEDRLDGPADEPRPGRPRAIENDREVRAIERTPGAAPADAVHSSVRSPVGAGGLPRPAARRVRTTIGPRPRCSETLKFSGDPAVRGQGPRHRGPPSVAAGPDAGVPRRGEEPAPGARPHEACSGDVGGHARTVDP